MKLTNIKGVGKSTADKLEKAGYSTLADLQGITVEELSDLGVHETTAEKIVESVKEQETVLESIEYHVEDATEFEMFAFKQSEDYDENNLEESYNTWYNKVLIADSKLKSE
ncbi:MAG: helix-hairpin-helix domain-containing protein [Methanobacterium sp. ERen5]|nr:MAG: helix-hairpin-helix domain-containing protein [Methanobacterium sp. ERen5]